LSFALKLPIPLAENLELHNNLRAAGLLTGRAFIVYHRLHDRDHLSIEAAEIQEGTRSVEILPLTTLSPGSRLATNLLALGELLTKAQDYQLIWLFKEEDSEPEEGTTTPPEVVVGFNMGVLLALVGSQVFNYLATHPERLAVVTSRGNEVTPHEKQAQGIIQVLKMILRLT